MPEEYSNGTEQIYEADKIIISRNYHNHGKVAHSPGVDEETPICENKWREHIDWMTKPTDDIPTDWYSPCEKCLEILDDGMAKYATPLRTEKNGRERWSVYDCGAGEREHLRIPVHRLAAYAWGIVDHPSGEVDPTPVEHKDGIRWHTTEENLRAGEVPPALRGEPRPTKHRTFKRTGKERWRVDDGGESMRTVTVDRLAAYAWGELDHPSTDVDSRGTKHKSGIPWLTIEDDLYTAHPSDPKPEDEWWGRKVSHNETPDGADRNKIVADGGSRNTPPLSTDTEQTGEVLHTDDGESERLGDRDE